MWHLSHYVSIKFINQETLGTCFHLSSTIMDYNFNRNNSPLSQIFRKNLPFWQFAQSMCFLQMHFFFETICRFWAHIFFGGKVASLMPCSIDLFPTGDIQSLFISYENSINSWNFSQPMTTFPLDKKNQAHLLNREQFDTVSRKFGPWTSYWL